MKILMNRKPVSGAWGGGNHFVKAFCEYGPKYGHEIVHTVQEGIDVILMVDPRYDELRVSMREIAAYKKTFHNVKIVHRINENDARKGTNDMDDLLYACSQITDVSTFISNWIKYYHIDRGWMCKNNTVIYSGTDKSVFKPREKINNGKINLVTHHWSNNKMKGFDFYEQLDSWLDDNPDFTFTYIGRENGTFKNTKVIQPLFGEALGKELGQYDVYISASRFDPGPNHIIEALACDLPTYAFRDGGGCCEFVGVQHVYQSYDDLIYILEGKKYSKNLTPFEENWYDWKDCMAQYFDLIGSL